MTNLLTVFANSPDRGRGLARDMRVRWAIEELGLAYDTIPLTFAQMKEPDYLTQHPFGQIPVFADGRVRLEIAGEAGERFIIQCSSNLKDWVTLGTRTTNAEGVLTFEDADAGPHRTRFYRVVLE